MKVNRSAATRVALLAATSFATLGVATHASAQVAFADTFAADAFVSEESPTIFVRDDIDPNATGAGGSLDTGVTGVGQMIVFVPAGGLSLCSGTLINPRTVIFAAHCVNSRPAHQYGSATGSGNGVNANSGAITGFVPPTTANPTGVSRALITSTGVPLSFGFDPRNRCTGVVPGVNANPVVAASAGNGCAGETGAYESWRNAGFVTDTSKYIYNANQVWYDTRSLTTPGSNGFIVADVALATLDTPAFDVPSWAMLFSPLSGPAHALSIGYGTNGTSASGQGGVNCTTAAIDSCRPLGAIDYRRRAVENMISVLGSMVDRNLAMFGVTGGATTNNLYMLDFDSPTGPAGYSPPTNYDFDVFLGAALPKEGTTAGGDSGGPLVVDQAYTDEDGNFQPVVAAVLSGGSRFFGAQRFSTYGTHSFYQPLHLYWDQIVANNPYVYAGNKAGDGTWEDPNHWVQLMDPNYMIDVGGELVNSLPDTAAQGIAAGGAKFGTICNGPCAAPLSGTQPSGSGTPVYVAGGPGTESFVPDNVAPINSANASLHRKARYFDVTLAAAGTTTLSSNRTIDVLTLNGATKLDIAGTGTLNVFGEATQKQGWTNVDGALNSGGDMLIATGLLTGRGTIKAPFVTVGAGIVAPGGGGIGTLRIEGNAILSSGAALFVDVKRGNSDQLNVTGVLSLATTPANGASLVFSKANEGLSPRHGEKFTIATATEGVEGKFRVAYDPFQGVLRPKLAYVDSNDLDDLPDMVIAEMRAGSLVDVLNGGNATDYAFATVLDQLRNGFYDKLWNLYGNVDWMNAGQLSATFTALSPVNMVGEVRAIHDRQNARFLGRVGDRLSLMGTGRAEGISFVGGASALAQSRDGLSASAQLGLTNSNSVNIAAPNGLSGFVSMGDDTIGSTYGGGEQSGQHSRYFASGIEAPFGDAMIGTAIGYAETRSMAGQDEAKSKVSQAAAYASLPVGKSAYVGGVVAAERASSDSNRLTTDTTSMFRLSGATHSARYMANLEAGVRKSIGSGLYLNPRAQLGVSHYALGGFRETGGETALALDTLKVNRIESRFGARLDGTATLGSWSVRPNLQADYVRLLAGADAGLKVAFAAAPDHSFALPLVGGGSGWMEVKGGIELTRGKLSLGLSGQATAGDAPIADQRGAVDLSFRF